MIMWSRPWKVNVDGKFSEQILIRLSLLVRYFFGDVLRVLRIIVMLFDDSKGK